MFTLDTDIEGLYLTLAEPQYAGELFNLVEQNRSYLRKWLPWLDHNNTLSDSESFLKNCQAMYASQSQLNTLIFKGDHLIGTTGFNSINHLNHHGEIGYWLGEKFCGKGYMTAAVKKIIEIGFNDYGLNRQIIRAATGNLPSQNVAKRLKFQHEGTLREEGYLYGKYHDLEVFSLLKNEWC